MVWDSGLVALELDVILCVSFVGFSVHRTTSSFCVSHRVVARVRAYVGGKTGRRGDI